jgi:hypothetical protein
MNKKILAAIIGLFLIQALAASAQVTFETVRSNMNEMTDAQFKNYTKSLVGQTITWDGWVEEVKEKFFGGYECWIDMDAPKELSVQDVTFPIDENLAMQLRKDKRVQFTGTIKSVYNILGSCSVSLSDARILKQEQ